MIALLITVHTIACLFLILVVLLQTGKGAEMGAVFGGGGSQTIFGASGAGNLLTKLTTGTAVLFFLTSLTLAWVSLTQTRESVFDQALPEPPPLEESGTGEAPPLDAPPAAAPPADVPEETTRSGPPPLETDEGDAAQ